MKDLAVSASLALVIGVGWWIVTRSTSVALGTWVTATAANARPRPGRSRIEVGLLISLVWAVADLYARRP